MKHQAPSTNGSCDAIACLVCLPGYSATKTFVTDAAGKVIKRNFNAGTLFHQFEQPINNILELSEALTVLEKNPSASVIRGSLCDPTLAGEALRRLGSGEGHNFKGHFKTPAQGRHWVLIDVDKLKLPKSLPLTAKNLGRILHWITDQLPPELEDVSFHWQLSSSAGVFGADSVSAHFWFWLTQPATNADLKAWGAAFNASSKGLKIDLALFQHVQAHYTAAPVFEGMADPFPKRSGLTRKGRDAATIVAPSFPHSVVGKHRPKGKVPTISKGPSGFEAIVESIGDHLGGAGFHQPLVRAAASYVSTHGAANTDPQALYERLSRAVREADSSAHTPEDIEERASIKTIMPMIKSAMKKFGNKASIHSPHLIKGAPPSTRISHTQLSPAQIAAEIQTFFTI